MRNNDNEMSDSLVCLNMTITKHSIKSLVTSSSSSASHEYTHAHVESEWFFVVTRRRSSAPVVATATHPYKVGVAADGASWTTTGVIVPRAVDLRLHGRDG